MPVHPEDRPLLGMAWKGKLFVDTALPFGLRSAPKIFSAVADALQWILAANRVESLHYLDDFIVFGPPDSPACCRALEKAMEVCKRLGVPIAEHKTEGLAAILTFLGIEINTLNIYIGKTSTDICPVSAMLSYLVVWGRKEGPLFLFKDGRFLTRQRLVEELRKVLRKTGVDQSKYCGHSFRIGAATTAAARGIEDSVIKTLGRWKSLAYLQYVRIPRQELAHYSRLLSS